MILNIGLVQINTDFGGAHYLPYSVGALQAYAKRELQNPQDFKFLLPLYKRIPPQDSISQISDADVVFFSLYVWNKEMSFEVARKLKQKKPSIITVFGGPEVPNHLMSTPDRVERFLQNNRFMDIACHGEGEQVFLKVLQNYDRDWDEIPSISYFDSNGKFRKTPRAERLQPIFTLDKEERILDVPSPYLEGIFDDLMKENPDEEWLMLWETNRGCPFSCSFCDWGDLIAAKVFRFDMERLKKELEWAARHKIEFIFCADANFGIFRRDVDIARYAAEIRKRYSYPRALSVQNAKNAEERIFEAQFILAQAGLNKGVTLAFQSRDKQTLKDIRRDNISSEDFKRLQKKFTEAKIETYSDMIIALPGETYDSFARGISDTIKDGQHNRIQYGNLSVLPNAEMGDPAYLEKYGMKTVSVKAVTYHGSIFDPEWEVDENEELVVETNSMSQEDWVRTRVFCWMSALLHFDKIFQIPLVLLNSIYEVSYRELIEIFSECDSKKFPIVLEIKNFFKEKARSIQEGDVEYCAGHEYLNIWWPADEFIFIKLMREYKLTDFYAQAREAIGAFFKKKKIDIDYKMLDQAIMFNKYLIKRPFCNSDLVMHFDYNLWEFYRSVLEMRQVSFEKKKNTYYIDRTSEKWESWEDWYKKVVWFGNKKGAYLYGNKVLGEERGGHF